MPSAPALADSPGGELLDLLSVEGREHLESFATEDQQLFAELIEDAASDLQSELIRRALAARHTPKELHAFADQIRGMDDEEVYAAVTLEELGPGGVRRNVIQRMRAEADPIYGFTLNGHTLTGDGVVASGFDALGLPVRPRPSFDAPPALSVPAESDFENSIARGRRIERHELGESQPEHTTGRRRAIDRRELGESQPENTTGRGRALAGRELGASGNPPSHTRHAIPSNTNAGNDVFSQAVKALGYSYREVIIEAQLPLGKALDHAIAALKRGLPVPATLGSVQGNLRRAVLFLQASQAGKGCALQLHEPQSGETVWVNEVALRSGGELPLSNKSLRRLIKLALPRMKEGK